jgi:hypothetical protein
MRRLSRIDGQISRDCCSFASPRRANADGQNSLDFAVGKLVANDQM